MEQIARFKPGQNLPVFADKAVLAGRFLAVNGDKTARGAYPVEHCPAGEKPLGVCEADSGPTTQPEHSTDRHVNCVRRGAVARVLCQGEVAAGEEVEVGTEGRALALASGEPAGRALSSGDDSIIEVDLY